MVLYNLNCKTNRLNVHIEYSHLVDFWSCLFLSSEDISMFPFHHYTVRVFLVFQQENRTLNPHSRPPRPDPLKTNNVKLHNYKNLVCFSILSYKLGYWLPGYDNMLYGNWILNRKIIMTFCGPSRFGMHNGNTSMVLFVM